MYGMCIIRAAIRKQYVGNHSFGGVNIIILGNFHQFPLMAHSIYDALFYPNNSEMDSSLSMIGRTIYKEFTIVVILKEQKRITDTVWHNFLQHLHTSSVKKHHIDMLQRLIVEKSLNMMVDFSQALWETVSLVTPQHVVRQ